jgi:uncharacterized protein
MMNRKERIADMTARRNDERTVAGERRMMRRADREVTDPTQAMAIIEACKIIRIAYMDAEGLTVVPMNFGFENEDSAGVAKPTFYFHSAPIGRKMDAIKAADNALPVAFEMETDCEVVEGRTPCNWGEAFKSVVGTGVASIVDDPEESRTALGLLMKQQAGMEHVEFTDQQIRSVTVWKVESDYVTAKVRKKPEPRR